MLFGRGDRGQLAAALRALRDDATVERMSRAAYATFWTAPPTSGEHVSRLRSVYDDVLAGTAR
jgi:hypothetical protein